MKRSCRVYLTVFVGAGILGGLALAAALPPPSAEASIEFSEKLVPSLVAGFIASLLLTLGLFALHGTVEARRDREKFSRPRLSAPADGEKVIASGRLVADGPLLEAPLSATRCVAYRYEVRRLRTRSTTPEPVNYVWGYGLTPSHIETEWGAVRLLSFADLADPIVVLDADRARERAVAWLGANPPIPSSGAAKKEFFAAQDEFHRDADGVVRGDFGELESDVRGSHFYFCEKLLLAGEPVTAVGSWDAQQGGLKGEAGNEVLGSVTVRKGTVEKTVETLRKQAVGCAVSGIIFIALAVVVVSIFLSFPAKFAY